MGLLYVAVLMATGYLWTELSYPAHYRQTRAEGWNAYFNAAKYGIIFFLLALPVLFFLDTIDVGYRVVTKSHIQWSDIHEWPLNISELKQVSWAVIALALVLMIGAISKIFFYLPGIKEYFINRLCKSDRFEEILVYVAQQFRKDPANPVYISISLKSRKVYVGFVRHISFEHGHPSSIEITPLLSGFRGATRLAHTFTTNYFEHYSSVYEDGAFDYRIFEEFRIVLIRSEIESLNLFSLDHYLEFQKRDGRERQAALT